MARNFRGLKISLFSRIGHEPQKFYPQNFALIKNSFNRTYCAYTCSAFQSFLVYFAQLLCHYGSLPIFQASEKSSCKLPDPRGPLSRLVPLSSILGPICQWESAVCWKARSTLRVGERDNATPSSFPNWRPKSAGGQQSTVWLLQSGCTLKGYWEMGVVNLEVGRASGQSLKIKSRKV